MDFILLLVGFISSVLVGLFIMPKLIRFLHTLNSHQTVSEYALKDFKEKAKTPTMGGIMFVLVPIVVTLILYRQEVFIGSSYLVMLAYLGYGLIGFIDDYIIVVQKNNKGLSPRAKLIAQVILAVLFYFVYSTTFTSNLSLNIPILNIELTLGVFYIFLVYFVFAGTSNAVNLTDGMDGLAGGTSFIAIAPFVFFAVIAQDFVLATFLLSVMGALVAYLRYNLFPAKIFMGDTGALALGGLLAASAIVLGQEINLVVIGGVFVWVTMTCIIQITSVKLFKRRVFKYTPIHYSFKLSGMSEPKIVLMFWSIGFICAVIGLLIGVM